MVHELAVEADRLSVRRGGREILAAVSLQVPAGGITGVVGPSGAGKSTLLKTIGLLVPPDGGTLRLWGNEVTGRRPVRRDPQEAALVEALRAAGVGLRRRLALVPQTPHLFRGSVLGNAAYGLWVRGVGRAEREKRGREWLERVGLGEHAFRWARSLSGGEAQRLALARALAVEPELLCLDEVTAHLDPANVAFIEELLAGIAAEGRTTIILASHNLFQARRLANRVIFLLDGTLVETAPASEFFEASRDPRTRDFLAGRFLG